MQLFHLLFLIFLSVPLIEIYLLLKVGGIIGALPTITAVVATAIIGAWLLRIQGFSTWQRLQKSLAQGEIPAMEIIEGPILLVGGALLLTPGFLTDALGFLCLFPVSRRKIAAYLMEKTLNRDIEIINQYRDKYSKNTIEGQYKKED